MNNDPYFDDLVYADNLLRTLSDRLLQENCFVPTGVYKLAYNKLIHARMHIQKQLAAYLNGN